MRASFAAVLVLILGLGCARLALADDAPSGPDYRPKAGAVPPLPAPQPAPEPRPAPIPTPPPPEPAPAPRLAEPGPLQPPLVRRRRSATAPTLARGTPAPRGASFPPPAPTQEAPSSPPPAAPAQGSPGAVAEPAPRPAPQPVVPRPRGPAVVVERLPREPEPARTWWPPEGSQAEPAEQREWRRPTWNPPRDPTWASSILVRDGQVPAPTPDAPRATTTRLVTPAPPAPPQPRAWGRITWRRSGPYLPVPPPPPPPRWVPGSRPARPTAVRTAPRWSHAANVPRERIVSPPVAPEPEERRWSEPADPLRVDEPPLTQPTWAPPADPYWASSILAPRGAPPSPPPVPGEAGAAPPASAPSWSSAYDPRARSRDEAWGDNRIPPPAR